jgi:glycosyltransferase involved in cell wall biosynthesis
MNIVYISNNNGYLGKYFSNAFKKAFRATVFHFSYIKDRPVPPEEFWRKVAHTVRSCECDLVIYDFGLLLPDSLCEEGVRSVCLVYSTPRGEHISGILTSDSGIEGIAALNLMYDIDYEPSDKVPIIAASNQVKNEVIDLYEISKDNVVVIDFGVEIPRQEIAQDVDIFEVGIDFRNPAIVGYFSCWQDWRDRLSRIQKRIPSVCFVNLRDVSQLESVDMLIHLPHYEGFSPYSVEAMLRGVPVVTTETGIFKNPMVEIPEFVEVVSICSQDWEIEAALEKIVGLSKRYTWLDLENKYISFAEDNFSFDGFKEEWTAFFSLCCIDGLGLNEFKDWLKKH